MPLIRQYPPITFPFGVKVVEELQSKIQVTPVEVIGWSDGLAVGVRTELEAYKVGFHYFNGSYRGTRRVNIDWDPDKEYWRIDVFNREES